MTEKEQDERCVMRFDLATRFLCAMLTNPQPLYYENGIVSAAVSLADEMLDRIDRHVIENEKLKKR